MLTFHASMPALASAALRRLYLLYALLFAAVAGVVTGLLGPGLPTSSALLGAMLAAQLAAEAMLRRRARRDALPFVPRREWRAAWRRANGATPVPWVLVRALLLALGVAQAATGRPVWAMSPGWWAGVALHALLFFLVDLCTRELPAART